MALDPWLEASNAGYDAPMTNRIVITSVLIGVAFLGGCGIELPETQSSARKVSSRVSTRADTETSLAGESTPSPLPLPCPSYRPGMDPRDYGGCYNGPGMPLGLGIPDTPHPTPTPRDPLPLKITRDEALQAVAGRIANISGTGSAQLDLIIQCTLGEEPKYTDPGIPGGIVGRIGPGDRFNFDPVWVVRYVGTFNQGSYGNFKYMAFVVDGHTGDHISLNYGGRL